MWCFQWFVLTGVLCFLDELMLFGVLSYVTEPQLQDLSNGHTIIGEDIILECTVICDKPNVSIEWTAPINLKLTLDRVNINRTEALNSTVYSTSCLYRIQKSRIEDNSVYYCRASNPKNPFDTKLTYIWVPVYNTSEHVIEFDKEHSLFYKAMTEIQVYVRAHPKPVFTWIDKNNNIIAPSSTKFTILTTPINRFTNYKTVLAFNNISEEDFGNYTVIAFNQQENKSFSILVNVTGPPSTSLTVEEYDEDTNIIKYQTMGFPKPRITWAFKTCNSLSCFEEKAHLYSRNSTEMNEFKSEGNNLRTISYIMVNKSDIGVIKAKATNTLGSASSVQYIYDTPNGFEVFIQNMMPEDNGTKVETLYHDNIQIVCSISLKEYHHEIKWYRDGRNMSLDDSRVPIRGFDEYHIKHFDAIYSSVSVLKIDIDKTDQGNYYCKASRKDGKVVSKVINLIVRESPVLNVASNMQNNTALVKYGNSWKFYCRIVDNYPTPSIAWIKNNTTLTNSTKIQINDNNQTLSISEIGPSDNGTYRCEVTNRLKKKEVRIATLGAIENDFDWLIVAITILGVVLSTIVAAMAVKVNKENKLKEELKLAGLANFETGAVDSINPQLRVEDQADLLPYDKKWEIPIENLTLGKELGSGAFGVVVQGELAGLPNKETVTTVAVKTVTKFAGYECIKALASELKIMVHLGRHLNIVNLIGACTKDVMKRKLLVVVEFCPFGNLQEHILFNSNRFVDQRVNDVDGFDWTIGPNSCEKEKSASNLQYTTVCFTSDSSNSSKSPEDDKLKFMCSQDFLIWALQISKGNL